MYVCILKIGNQVKQISGISDVVNKITSSRFDQVVEQIVTYEGLLVNCWSSV